MFRLLSITLLFILPLQSIASVSYSIRIAVYNNIDSLEHELNKLSPALRKTVEIQKRGEQYIACSIQTKDKTKLQQLLPSYQKVFPDAFIATYQITEMNMVKETDANKTTLKTLKTTEANKTPADIKQEILYHPDNRKIVNPTKENIPLYDRFHQKTLYLCAYGKDIRSPNVLIHVAFFDKEVVYTPIMGEVSSRRERYTIDNNKLYISRQGLFDSEIYNTLDSVTSEYYLVSGWVGKTKVNTIRYYYDLEKAEAYVASLK
jgi:hypothetical protein